MKTYFSILILFSITQPGFSQSCETLNKKVIRLIQEGDFKEALRFAEKAAKKCEDKDATLLSTLAYLHKIDSNYNKAIPLYLESIQTARFEKNWHIYLNSLIDLAHIYISFSEYPKAEIYLVQAYKFIRKNAEPGMLLQYANLMTDLANVYFEEADYGKAEPLYLKAFEINSNGLNNYHPALAISLTNLAKLYFTIGNYSKAEPFYLQAYEIKLKIFSQMDVDLCSTLDDLGDLYFNMGDSAKAVKFYVEAFNKRKTVFGAQNIHLASSLLRLGNLYSASGDYAKAEPLILQALEMRKSLSGEYSRDYSKTLESLALLYLQVGNYTKSDLFFSQLIEIKKKIFGELHPAYANSLFNLANLYSLNNENRKTDSILKLSIDIFQKNWRSNLRFLSTEVSEEFINNNKSKIEFALSFLNKNNEANSLTSVLTLDLFLKDILLSNNKLLRKKANLSNDSTVIIKWETYKLLRLKIEKQYQLPVDKQKDLKKMLAQIEVLERELMHKLPEFQKAFLHNNFTWKDVQRELKPNEAAIDFVSFNYFNKRWTDTILYAAFIIKSGWVKPQFVSLFREPQLADLLGHENNSLSIAKIYFKVNFKNNNKSIFNKSLYELIWQPRENHLVGIKKIFISPSGLLHRVSFSAISIPEGGKLIDRFEISTLNNVNILAAHHLVDTAVRSFALFGGIDYEKQPRVKINNGYVQSLATDSTLSFSELRNISGGKWAYLPGSLKEIVGIQKIVESFKIPIIKYSLQDASEENFKQLSAGINLPPSIIHIATHGFTFPVPVKKSKLEVLWVNDKKLVFLKSNDPLTRAGLVMAGGNEVWMRGIPFPNREDGILTAREVSNLNLEGCMLATLSACETGLGEIKGSEGVFGLQRSFKLAGVQQMILSLWQVPDKETVELMNIFYTNKLKGSTTQEAFNIAQEKMRKKYPVYYWAAFVLIE